MLTLSDYIQISIGLMSIFSPFVAIPIFISLTSHSSPSEKRDTARTASIAACIPESGRGRERGMRGRAQAVEAVVSAHEGAM